MKFKFNKVVFCFLFFNKIIFFCKILLLLLFRYVWIFEPNCQNHIWQTQARFDLSFSAAQADEPRAHSISKKYLTYYVHPRTLQCVIGSAHIIYV